MAIKFSLPDYIEMSNIAFEWADSYDNKDWNRLRRILAPKVTLDFRSINGQLYDDMTPDEYVALISSTAFIGDKSLKTQHFLGAAKWEQLDSGEVTAEYLSRMAHQRYTDDSCTTILTSGHGLGNAKHWYRQIEGRWKLVRIESTFRWPELDLFGALQGKKSEGF